LGAHSTRVH